MPIYIVRWPNLMASLVEAQDEEELVYRLDEVGDAGGCRWKEYHGPLWVDFELPVQAVMPSGNADRPWTMDEIEFDGTEKLISDPWHLESSLPEGDTTSEMSEAIRAFAFPALGEALRSSVGDEFNSEELKQAIREDTQPLLEYGWRLAQLRRRKDPEAALMQYMGTSVPFHWTGETGDDGGPQDDGDSHDE